MATGQELLSSGTMVLTFEHHKVLDIPKLNPISFSRKSRAGAILAFPASAREGVWRSAHDLVDLFLGLVGGGLRGLALQQSTLKHVVDGLGDFGEAG